MTIQEILSNKFNGSKAIFKILSEQSNSGFLSMGYVEKNTIEGSLCDLKLNHYDGVWVLAGSGIYRDSNNKEVLLKAGDFVQRLPNNLHSTLVTSDDWKEMYISVGKDLYHLLKEMNVVGQEHPVLHPGTDFELLETFLSFYDGLEKASPPELPLYTYKAIQIIARVHYLDKIQDTTTKEALTLDISRKYIIQNVSARPTVEEIAAHVNMGYEKFRKLFVEYYGVSPGYYMQQNRNHRAKELLSTNDLTIKEVAQELGYVDAYSFSKQFKKMTGISPKEFKKLYT